MNAETLRNIEKLQDLTPILEGSSAETMEDLRGVMRSSLEFCRENGIDTDMAVHIAARFVMDDTIAKPQSDMNAMFFILVYALMKKVSHDIFAGEKPESPTSTEKEV